MIYVAYKAYS